MLKRGISLFLALAMVFCTMPVETMAAEILTVNEFSGMEETTEPISTEETTESEEIPSESMCVNIHDSLAANEKTSTEQPKSAISGDVLSQATVGALTYSVNEDGATCTITDCDDSTSGELIIPEQLDNYIVTGISDWAFWKCLDIQSIVIPNSVVQIGSYAFRECNTLESIVIPESVQNVGEGIFVDCPKLISAGPIGGGYNVELGWTEIIPAQAFKLCTSFVEIEIPQGVKEIGNEAFYSCTNLTSLTIPESVLTVGDWFVFFNCDKLTSAGPIGSGCNIQFGWTSEIPAYAFSQCTGLDSVEIPESVTALGDSAFNNCISLKEVSISSNLTSIGRLSFAGCSNLTEIIIPQGVVSIGEHAFQGCSGLRHIVVPESVSSIGMYAFLNCTSLTSAGPIGSNCDYEYGWETQIPGNAFSGGQGLEKVIIPETVESFAGSPFGMNTELTDAGPIGSGCDIEFGWKEQIPDSAFSQLDSLENVQIPQGITRIGAYAFYKCTSLKSVVIPDGVTNVGSAAFQGCTSLSHVVIPESVVSLIDGSNYEGPFMGCTLLTSAGPIGTGCDIEFGWSQQIPSYAFYNCYQISYLQIPEGIEKIGSMLFGRYNSQFESAGPIGGGYDVEFGWTTSIPDGAFVNFTSLTYIQIPGTITKMGQYVFQSYLTNAGPDLTSAGPIGSNCDIEYGWTEFIPAYAFANIRGLEKVIIPEGIVSMGEGAFNNCPKLISAGPQGSSCNIEFGWSDKIPENAFAKATQLVSVNIPEPISVIGKAAFASCEKLSQVLLPDTLTGIQEKAFYYCSALQHIELPDSVSEIGKYAFSGSGLEQIDIPTDITKIDEATFSSCSNLTHITIPDKVESIEKKAFSNCNSLKTVTLPISVVQIDEGAFYSCDALTDVYYKGTKNDQMNIELSEKGEPELTNAEWHYGSDGPDNSGDKPVNPPEEPSAKVRLQIAYFSEWDAEKQVAYFKIGPGLGAEVTEETDTSFLDSVEEMLNQYVLVEARPRDDGMIGPAILLRMELVEAGVGTIQAYTEDSLTINDIVYPLALKGEEPVIGADKGFDVLYGVQDGKIVILVPLVTTTMRIDDWDFASRELTVSQNLSTYTYKVSTLASEESLAFLNAFRNSGKDYRIEFASAGEIVYRVYRIYEEPKSPEYYDTPRYETTQEALLGDYAMDWYQAYEDYTEALNKALTSYAGSEDAGRTSLIIAMAEDMQKKDSGSYSRYLTWNGETTATVRSAGYKALAALLYDYACSNPDFSNVDFSSTTAGTALVKAVMKSMSSTSASYSFEGVDVNLHVFQFGSEKFGNMTCTLNGKQYSAVICSTQTECYETIESYWESLKDLETQALFNIYTAVATDIWGKSPTTFTKEFLKKHIEKYADDLLKAGVGDVVTALNTCCNYYSFVNKICNGDLDNLENLLGTMGSLKFDDSSITDKAVNKAMKALKKATDKLNQASADYIAGTLETPLIYSLKQLIVACPVKVLIYNAVGEQIGYVGEDDFWYEDSIRITEEGDAKIIDILSAQDISVRFIGTAAGSMSCSIEEYTTEGVPIGRLNFYQIPVQEGQELEMKVPERLTGSLQDTCIRTETESIFPNEYMTVNDAGCVSVTCSVDPQAAKNGCMVSGAGSFVRGDAVVLTALSGENYNFIGWYQDGVLQSTSLVYEFPAIQDVSLSAVFAQPYQGYKVEVTAEKGGTAIGSSVFSANEVATVLANPNNGYEFKGWYVDGEKMSDSIEYSFAVQADTLLTASFCKISPEPEESPTPQPTETPAPYPSGEPTPHPSEAPTSVPNTTPVPQPTTTTVSEYGTTPDIVKSDDAEKTQAQETDLPNEDSPEPSQTPQANEDESSNQEPDSGVQETEEQNEANDSGILLYVVLVLAAGCVIFGAVWYLWRRKRQ